MFFIMYYYCELTSVRSICIVSEGGSEPDRITGAKERSHPLTRGGGGGGLGGKRSFATPVTLEPRKGCKGSNFR